MCALACSGLAVWIDFSVLEALEAEGYTGCIALMVKFDDRPSDETVRGNGIVTSWTRRHAESFVG